jgi:hypothetical protein
MRIRMIAGAAAAMALAGGGLAALAGSGGGTPQAMAQANVATSTGNPAAADQAAATYASTHHPGPGPVRVLATEPDTDRGIAVYDVRVLAPNRTVYVVHVQRGNTTVLWVNRAENQSAGAPPVSPGSEASPGHGTAPDSPDSKDAPDHNTASSGHSPDHQDQPDTSSHHSDG